jgi:putative glycosyltransferase (TIGR04372 family)
MQKNHLNVYLNRVLEKTLYFLLRQVSHIKEGGFLVVVRKLRFLLSIIISILLTFPAIPIVIIMRTLRPFVAIRLGPLDLTRIGALCHAEWYLCERYANTNCNRYLDIFYYAKTCMPIANYPWLKMWKRLIFISIFFGRFIRSVDKLNRCLPGHASHIVPKFKVPIKNERLKAILACKKPFLTFTPEEEIRGKESLREIGIPEGVPYICFHARDSAYLDAVDNARDWSYHDYRDSNINNYLYAVEQLACRGYYGIRMGAIVKENLNTNNPRIIDYASNGKRTDFMDIYLGAKCRFFICADTGLTQVPESFRLPIVYANLTHLAQLSTYSYNCLSIGKKFYLSGENRFLTFREIINSELGYIYDAKLLTQYGVELIENTPEEIAAVAIEMDERLKGTWKTTQEDEELQRRFWEIYGSDKLKSPDFRIGTEFLRQNRELLK